ncbi:MAG: pyruvate carboxylase subunit B, partial [Bacillota bacterium]|nr:pyruvate carboxylase subunit B [Bacillota bacterium]
MNFETNTKLLITDTILRDAHQSQAATRMKFEEMEPALSALDQIGYYSLECWGGATFDSCLRFLNEDPWERLRKLRKALPNTKLQMLFRGQNILGYKNYADDVVDLFCKKSIENGIDIIRVFDALNDTRNLKQAMTSIKKYGGICEAAISYTISPVHNEDYFVSVAKELESMGADIITIKDMAALLLPDAAYSLVKRLKAELKVPIHLHTHDTTGCGEMTALASALAGVDIIDTALSSLGGGTSQPATEPLVAALKGTVRDTELDITALSNASKLFAPAVERMKAEGYWDAKVKNIDANALIYQVPGGMLSNLISQLKNMNASDKLPLVLEEVPRVRKDFGYPPLVTPTSQIVGTQAVMNVLSNERYKVIPKESIGLLKGEYGRLPAEINPDVLAKAGINPEDRITCRPADLLEPQLPAIREKYKDIIKSDEDLLSVALFPEVAEKFLRGEATVEAPKAVVKNIEKETNVENPMVYKVKVNGEEFTVEVDRTNGKQQT